MVAACPIPMIFPRDLSKQVEITINDERRNHEKNMFVEQIHRQK
jgi:hypothetical protein